MDLVGSGVAIGVGTDPAVVLDGGVQGLRAVADVVAEPAGIEDDGLLDGAGVVSGGGKMAILAQGGLQPFPDFVGFPWLQADFFRVVRRRQRLWLQSRAGWCGRGPRASAGSRSMKCSGACAAFSSGSAGERQRSGSGPRYSISLRAVIGAQKGRHIRG